MICFFALITVAASCSASPPVTALSFSPDGKHVLAGSQSGIEVRSWPDLSPIRTLPTGLSQIHDIVFSPDRRRFSVAGGSPSEVGALEVWSWPEGELMSRCQPHEDVIYRVAWRSDGQQLACAGGDHLASLINVDSLQVQRKLAGHSRAVTSVVYLPDDRFLVTAGLDETLRVWDLGTGEVIRSLTNHTSGVRDVAVQPHTAADSPVIASAGADRTVRLWQPLTGRMLRFAKVAAEPLDLEWSSDGSRILVSCTDGHLRVIDPATVSLLLDKPALDGWAYTVTSASDPENVLIGGSGGQLRTMALVK